MRWLIFARQPARLHALLESATLHMPYAYPEVLIDLPATDELWDCYVKLNKRFKVGIITTHPDKWRETLRQVILRSHPNGHTARIILFSTDRMLLFHQARLHDAWKALQDGHTLGVSLTLSPSMERSPAEPRHFRGSPSGLHTWEWVDQPAEWGRAFDFGVVYRTSDILGPISRLEYHSPESLREAIYGDPGLSRRSRMACLAEACMMDQPEGGLDGMTTDYRNNRTLNLDALMAGRMEWVG